MSFHEVRFPVRISFGSTGGPTRKTEVITLASGYEERNTTWSQSRRKYDAGYGIKTLDDMHEVLKFFEARLGRLHGFRWKDRFDNKSCPPLQIPTNMDQVIGTGTGALTTFQVKKTYADAAASYVRDITKPIAGTLLVSVNGAANTNWTLNATTGIITFGAAPAAAAIIRAGYEFDVPVRFDTDELQVSWETFRAGRISNIPIVEVRL
jgi:uncharacterized protein (TIGR02217 family)